MNQNCVATKYNRWYTVWATAMLCALILAFGSYSQTSALPLGGFVSSRLGARSGVADSTLVGARSGVADSTLIGATAPRVTTGAPIVSGPVNVTVQGSVAPPAAAPATESEPDTVYFEWGYDPAALTNTTTPTVVTSPGTFSDTPVMAPPPPSGGSVLYYRAVAEGDSTSYGAIVSTILHQGIVIGTIILRGLLSAVVAAGVILRGLIGIRRRTSALAFGMTIISGLVAFIIVEVFLTVLNIF